MTISTAFPTLARVSSSTKLAARAWDAPLAVEALGNNEAAENAVAVLPEFRPWVDEVFARLFDSRGAIEKPADDQNAWARQATATLRAQAEWSSLVETSSFHPLVAKATAKVIAKDVAGALRLDEHAKRGMRTDDVDDIKRALAEARARHEQALADGDDESASEAAGDVAELGERLAKANVERSYSLAVRSLPRDTMSEAMRTAEAARDAVRFFGGFSPDGVDSVTEEHVRLFMAKKVNVNVLNVLGAKLFGGERKGKTSTAGVVVGVTIGGDVRRLIPSESSRLAMRATRTLALKTILDEEAIIYDVEDDEQKKRRGPVVIVLDRSGSMECSMDVDGIATSRMEVARAVALEAMRRCVQERREVRVVIFNGEADLLHGTTMEVAEAVSRLHTGGGTNFVAAYSEAASAVSSLDGDADVLVVSDAESDEINAGRLALRRRFPHARAALVHIGDGCVSGEGWDIIVTQGDVVNGNARKLGKLFA